MLAPSIVKIGVRGVLLDVVPSFNMHFTTHSNTTVHNFLSTKRSTDCPHPHNTTGLIQKRYGLTEIGRWKDTVKQKGWDFTIGVEALVKQKGCVFTIWSGIPGGSMLVLDANIWHGAGNCRNVVVTITTFQAQWHCGRMWVKIAVG
jgi:hypothetical protein